MDYSAIIFIILLGLPWFFFWRWIFRKKSPPGKRRVLIWLTTILTAPVLYAVLIIGWISISEYYPNRDFDAKAWKADSDMRYEYSHDLIKSNILIGKTKRQVMELLGNNDTSQTEWYYYIGYRPEITGIDPSSIYIDFKNGKVDSVAEHDR